MREPETIGRYAAGGQPLTAVCALQDSSQIELLKELLDLQKDMVVMLLSLLEGEHWRRGREWGWGAGKPKNGATTEPHLTLC